MSPESVYKPVEKLGVGDNRPPQFGQMSEKSVSSHYGATVCRIFDPFSDFVHWQKPTSDFCHGHQGSPNFSQNLGKMKKILVAHFSKTVQISRHRCTNLSSRGPGTSYAPYPGSGRAPPTKNKNFQKIFFFRNALKRVFDAISASKKWVGGILGWVGGPDQ